MHWICYHIPNLHVICMYIHMYTYTYISTHMYYTTTHVNISHTNVPTHMYTHVHRPVCIHMHVHQTQTCTILNTIMYNAYHIPTYMHIYTYVHLYTHQYKLHQNNYVQCISTMCIAYPHACVHCCAATLMLHMNAF